MNINYDSIDSLLSNYILGWYLLRTIVYDNRHKTYTDYNDYNIIIL